MGRSATRGGISMTLSSRMRLERRLIPEHCPEDIDSASSERDDCLVVSFALLPFAVVVGAGNGCPGGGGWGGQERGSGLGRARGVGSDGSRACGGLGAKELLDARPRRPADRGGSLLAADECERAFGRVVEFALQGRRNRDQRVTQ